MSGYTKGPWQATPRLDFVFASGSKIADDTVFVIESAGFIIAEVTAISVNDVDDTDRADARLIAAAPELYEALKALVAIDDAKIADETSREWARLNPLFDAARAAIAKSEGRS